MYLLADIGISAGVGISSNRKGLAGTEQGTLPDCADRAGAESSPRKVLHLDRRGQGRKKVVKKLSPSSVLNDSGGPLYRARTIPKCVLVIEFYAGLPARYIRPEALKYRVTSRPRSTISPGPEEASMN